MAEEIIKSSAINSFLAHSFRALDEDFRGSFEKKLLPYLLSLLHSIHHTLKDASAKVSLSVEEVIKSQARQTLMENISKEMKDRLEHTEQLPRSMVGAYIEGMRYRYTMEN